VEEKDLKFNILRLLETKGIGFSRFWSIWKILKNKIKDGVFGLGEINKFLKEKEFFDWQSNEEKVYEKWKRLVEDNVNVISFEDDKYPHKLIPLLERKAPPLLMVLGNSELLSKPSVGFCGSRDASPKGLETAYDCAEQLSKKGINIVSGYAHGVDMTTHRAALEAGGTTILVLPEGILNFRIKKELSSIWNWDKILVISEFLPGLPWSVHNAMQRNSIICGLSEAVILIEAKSKGGSIEAGKTCLKLKLPLFAPVYDGMPESAVGNRELLDQGALPLFKSQTSDRANISKILELIDSRASENSPLKTSPISQSNQLSFFGN